jgi:hypothetical protein
MEAVGIMMPGMQEMGTLKEVAKHSHAFWHILWLFFDETKHYFIVLTRASNGRTPEVNMAHILRQTTQPPTHNT